MKKLLVPMIALMMAISLAACGGSVDKQPLTDSYNEASKAFNEVGTLINENADAIDDETVEDLNKISESLLEYKALAEGDEKLTQEQVDTAVEFLKTVPASMKEIKTEIEKVLAGEDDDTTYELDYSIISAWVDSGFIGNDDSGAPVVMAIDEANENAIIIFGDNSDMTAASVMGPVTYTDTTGTIEDEVTGISLTFGVNKTSDDTIELDMGDIGKATIKAASKEEVLETIKNAIDNYKHIA